MESIRVFSINYLKKSYKYYFGFLLILIGDVLKLYCLIGTTNGENYEKNSQREFQN